MLSRDGRIVLVVWSYGVCFSWVGESDLEMGLRMGIFIVGLCYLV